MGLYPLLQAVQARAVQFDLGLAGLGKGTDRRSVKLN